MRSWSPREFNILQSYGLDPFKLSEEVDKNIPIEYLVGEADFFGRSFKVSKDTLIPRIETEQMIVIALDYLSRNPKPEATNFIDIGTGSGNIGVTFALELEKRGVEYKGTLIDISKEALQIAKKNATKLNAKNLTLENKDLSQISLTDFNLIFANLPYIPSSKIAKLQKSVKNFEPIIALDGGGDGLKYICELIKKLQDKKNFIAILEVYDEHNKLAAKNCDLNLPITIVKDENEKIRFWEITN